MVFMPDAATTPPTLPAAAAGALRGTWLAGRDTWFEFDYAQLLIHVS